MNFAVWAPNAERVSVVGDFNLWDGRRHSASTFLGGIWTVRPGPRRGEKYKYEVRARSGAIVLKSDPYASPPRCRRARPRSPGTLDYQWDDAEWMRRSRCRRQSPRSPRVGLRGASRIGAAASATSRSRTASWPTNSSSTAGDGLHARRAAARSASTRSRASGAIRRPATSRRRAATARRRTSRTSSIAATSTASA